MSDNSLRLIKEVELTSSFDQVEIRDVFSDKFRAYTITVDNLSTVGTTNTDVPLRFILSTGQIDTTTQYNIASIVQGAGISKTSLQASTTSLAYLGGATNQEPDGSNFKFDVFNPYEEGRTMVSGVASYRIGAGRYNDNVGVHRLYHRLTGFVIFGSQTFAKGVIRVYGYRTDLA